MKTFVFAIAALVACSATASAQYPPQYPQQQMPKYPQQVSQYGPGGPGCATCDDGRSHRFGLHPALRRIFGPSQSCSNCNNGYGYGNGYGRNVNTLPVAQGGQLAFPINPYVRSPRDFFMMD